MTLRCLVVNTALQPAGGRGADDSAVNASQADPFFGASVRALLQRLWPVAAANTAAVAPAAGRSTSRSWTSSPQNDHEHFAETGHEERLPRGDGTGLLVVHAYNNIIWNKT